MKKLICLFGISLLLFLTFFPSAVRADIIPPGKKSIRWCYEIVNMDEYSNYIFYTQPESSNSPGSLQVIKPGDCFMPYKFSNPTLYTAKKENLAMDKIEELLAAKSDRAVTNYIENNSDPVAANFTFFPKHTTTKNDSIKSVTNSLKIVFLSNDIFIVRKTKATYTYEDGRTEVKRIIWRDFLKTVPWLAEKWYIVLPLCSIGIIVLILLFRKNR